MSGHKKPRSLFALSVPFVSQVIEMRFGPKHLAFPAVQARVFFADIIIVRWPVLLGIEMNGREVQRLTAHSESSSKMTGGRSLVVMIGS